MLSTGSGVNGFTLDPSLGEFILTHPDIKVLLFGNTTSDAFMSLQHTLISLDFHGVLYQTLNVQADLYH